MPAEKFDSTDSPYRRFQVNWSRDREVQVSTVWCDPDKSTTQWDGTYVTLDRQQINDAIRALRKARDQAYGSDA